MKRGRQGCVEWFTYVCKQFLFTKRKICYFPYIYHNFIRSEAPLWTCLSFTHSLKQRPSQDHRKFDVINICLNFQHIIYLYCYLTWMWSSAHITEFSCHCAILLIFFLFSCLSAFVGTIICLPVLLFVNCFAPVNHLLFLDLFLGLFTIWDDSTPVLVRQPGN